MKRRIIYLLMALSLLLCGCDWMDGSHVSVEPHQEHSPNTTNEVVAASNYPELCEALEDMIRSGRESGVIQVADYDQRMVENAMSRAVSYAVESFPVGAYVVEEISYEIGAGGGKPAIAVEITYLRSLMEIQKIREAADMEAAWEMITQTLESHDAGVVLLVEDYVSTDLAQMVENYIQENPDAVMETPQITIGLYPESGTARVVELQFTYQNSRETLRQMQEQIQRLFTSAAMYVSADAADQEKYSQLYTFLMERFDYQLDTSITPAYSLLRHGVGDSKAFATVYAVMCRQAGLECLTVTGTRAGDPWYWNIVLDNGNYYHVDLLWCSELGGFREFVDSEMLGYVWDYSAYPACVTEYIVPTEETTPTQTDPSEETAATEAETTENLE